MTEALINWLRPPCDTFHINGRGRVFTGQAPFRFATDMPIGSESHERFFKVPWVISHDKARDCLWRVVGVERFMVGGWQGPNVGVGLIVVPWDSQSE